MVMLFEHLCYYVFLFTIGYIFLFLFCGWFWRLIVDSFRKFIYFCLTFFIAIFFLFLPLAWFCSQFRCLSICYLIVKMLMLILKNDVFLWGTVEYVVSHWVFRYFMNICLLELWLFMHVGVSPLVFSVTDFFDTVSLFYGWSVATLILGVMLCMFMGVIIFLFGFSLRVFWINVLLFCFLLLLHFVFLLFWNLGLGVFYVSVGLLFESTFFWF